MTTRLPIAFLLFLFASCGVYQYMTVNSSGAGKPDNYKDLVIENDSFLIRYNFNGPNAPVSLLIQNKLDQQVYIDWRRSGLVVNDKATSFVSNVVPITGTVTSTTVNWSKRWSSGEGNFYVEAVLPEPLTFLPPRSYTAKSALLSVISFTTLPDSLFTKTQYKIIDDTYRTVRRASFTDDNSPVRFRSYITIAIGENPARTVFYQHNFYISEIINTGLGPDNFTFMANGLGDHFYTVGSQSGY